MDMKHLFASFFLISFSFCAKAQFTITNNSTTSLLEVRSGDWPIEIQRVIKESDTCYVLSFRDQQSTTGEVNMSVVKFGNLTQLKYFQKGLTALKNGSNGDVATFKTYTIKRVDKKKEKEGIWYLLTCTDGGDQTNFQQSDADKMISLVKTL